MTSTHHKESINTHIIIGRGQNHSKFDEIPKKLNLKIEGKIMIYIYIYNGTQGLKLHKN